MQMSDITPFHFQHFALVLGTSIAQVVWFGARVGTRLCTFVFKSCSILGNLVRSCAHTCVQLCTSIAQVGNACVVCAHTGLLLGTITDVDTLAYIVA